jgi:hypothetical protein
VFTAPLHSNGRGSGHIENTALLLLREFISAGTCLPSRCLAVNVYSGSAIPAFRRDVTISCPCRYSNLGRRARSLSLYRLRCSIEYRQKCGILQASMAKKVSLHQFPHRVAFSPFGCTTVFRIFLYAQINFRIRIGNLPPWVSLMTGDKCTICGL